MSSCSRSSTTSARGSSDNEFRGCGFINSFGELGGTVESLAGIVRDHKADFQAYVGQLVEEAGGPAWLGPQLAILAEGAQTTAAIAGTTQAAADARRAAEILMDAAGLERPDRPPVRVAQPLEAQQRASGDGHRDAG